MRRGLPQLQEPGRREVAVIGQGSVDAHRVHDREAGRVHERVLALVVRSQPGQGCCLQALGNLYDAHSGGGVHGVEEPHRGRVALAAVDERPGLATDMVGGQQALVVVALEQ
jgi:hypothetical protein